MTTPNDHATQQLKALQAAGRQDRARTLSALNSVFRSGIVPSTPLDGRYDGQLMALDIAPGVTRVVEGITSRWLPWKGKRFEAATSRGDNIFTRDSLKFTRVLWPFYRGVVDDRPGTYRAFVFHTSTGPGLLDTDRQVLRLDYNIPGNPKRTLRRILDEVVEIGDGVYLGKAYVRWWWGKWQLVAYFGLSKSIG